MVVMLRDTLASRAYRETVGAVLTELRRAYLGALLTSPEERVGGKSDEFLRGAVEALRRVETWCREVIMASEMERVAPPAPEPALPWERVEVVTNGSGS